MDLNKSAMEVRTGLEFAWNCIGNLEASYRRDLLVTKVMSPWLATTFSKRSPLTFRRFAMSLYSEANIKDSRIRRK